MENWKKSKINAEAELREWEAIPKVEWTLDCNYYHEVFETVDELVDDVLESGMDPNFEVMRNGVRTGEMAFEFMTL